MARKATPSVEVDWYAQADLLKALADPYRLQIIALLRNYGEITSSDIQFNLERLAQATVSHHMGVLCRAGIVLREKRGVFVFHTLNEEVLTQVVTMVQEIRRG